MLSLYNSLGLDGASGANGNRLLVIGNDVRGSFPQYDRTTLRIDIDEDNPDEQGDFPGDPRTDIDQDGLVGASDLTILLGSWNLTVDQSSNPRADIDQDGLVGASDLTLLLGSWGKQFDVPEDGSEDGSEEEEEEEENGEDDGGGGEPNDPPIVGVVETINGLVYPTSRVNVSSSPALPAWIKERNV
jgi:hypothetical protein